MPVPTVKGHKLTDTDAVEQAFSYYTKDYNDGIISHDDGAARLLIWSRYRRLEHMSPLLQAHQSDESDVTIHLISARQNDNVGDRTAYVEISDKPIPFEE